MKTIFLTLFVLLFFSNCAFYNLKKAESAFYSAQDIYLENGEALYEDIDKTNEFVNDLNDALKFSYRSFQSDPNYTKSYLIHLEVKMIQASVDETNSQAIYFEAIKVSSELLKNNSQRIQMKACYYLAKSLLGLDRRISHFFNKVVKCSRGRINALTARQYMEFKDILQSLKKKYIPYQNGNFKLRTKES